jgi:hypothetical protein
MVLVETLSIMIFSIMRLIATSSIFAFSVVGLIAKLSLMGLFETLRKMILTIMGLTVL